MSDANSLKDEGNKAFAAHDWGKAVELYTKAIELNDKEPTFYTNRAQARPSYLQLLTTFTFLPWPCSRD